MQKQFTIVLLTVLITFFRYVSSQSNFRQILLRTFCETEQGSQKCQDSKPGTIKLYLMYEGDSVEITREKQLSTDINERDINIRIYTKGSGKSDHIDETIEPSKKINTQDSTQGGKCIWQQITGMDNFQSAKKYAMKNVQVYFISEEIFSGRSEIEEKLEEEINTEPKSLLQSLLKSKQMKIDIVIFFDRSEDQVLKPNNLIRI